MYICIMYYIIESLGEPILRLDGVDASVLRAGAPTVRRHGLLS